MRNARAHLLPELMMMLVPLYGVVRDHLAQLAELILGDRAGLVDVGRFEEHPRLLGRVHLLPSVRAASHRREPAIDRLGVGSLAPRELELAAARQPTGLRARPPWPREPAAAPQPTGLCARLRGRHLDPLGFGCGETSLVRGRGRRQLDPFDPCRLVLGRIVVMLRPRVHHGRIGEGCAVRFELDACLGNCYWPLRAHGETSLTAHTASTR